MQTSVIYVVDTSNDKYYAHHGQPVWPVKDACERQALATMVSTLGGTMEYVTNPDERRLSGHEVVIGLGKSAVTCAKLYAHLTCRAFHYASCLEDLSGLLSPAVVVTMFEYVDENLFDLLYDQCSLDVAPGVIFAYDNDQLRQQVLTRAAALYCAGTNFSERRIDVNPMIDAGYHRESMDYCFLGGSASEKELHDALSGTAGLLGLSTHSDGIDAYLKTNYVLCAVKGLGNTLDKEKAPSCVMTDFCHRCQIPLQEAHQRGYLLDPKLIKAHVLVYCACWGLYPSREVHLSKYALSRQIINSHSVGALITSWEINTQDLAVTSSLLHNIAQGVPLGKALAEHLTSQHARHIFHKLCLIGDPAISLGKAEAEDPLSAFRTKNSAYELSPKALYGLTLFRLIGKKFLEYGSEKASETVDDIESYESAILLGQINASHDHLFKYKMADFCARQDTMLSKVWSQYAFDPEVLPIRSNCPICARRTITRRYILRIPGGESRTETLCPSCGSVKDISRDRDIDFKVDQFGNINFNCGFPLGNWEARIVVERFFTRENKIWNWPCDESGKPKSCFKMPEAWPLTPFRVAVVIVYGDYEFAVVGALYRGKTLNEE